MRKIPTALVRDPDDRAHVLMEITPGCEWVFAGEGVATRKWDGTCTMLDEDGSWWARREVKPGKGQPPSFIVEDEDSITGKLQGWEPIQQSSFVKAFKEACEDDEPLIVGTYELIGPKINGDPDQMEYHHLVSHDSSVQVPGLSNQPITVEFAVEVVRKLGQSSGWEGIVFHHPDGRMAKLKARDLR